MVDGMDLSTSSGYLVSPSRRVPRRGPTKYSVARGSHKFTIGSSRLSRNIDLDCSGESFKIASKVQVWFTMYGEHGHKLVQHARRTQTLPHLPPYQPELVREVTRETRQLHKDTEDILAPFEGSFAPAADPPAAVNLLVDHLAMRRNKRCLLAYHKTRTDRLEEMIWRGEDVLESINSAAAGSGTSGDANGASAVSAEDGSKTSLSPEEEEYVRRFEDLLGVLKGQWTDIDLSGSMEPPKDLFVDVRVLKDAGEIQTEYGSIMLTKNSQFYVRQGDVERLIQQGYLQKLS